MTSPGDFRRRFRLRSTVLIAAVAVWLFAPIAHGGNADIVAAARSQIGTTIHYDPAYRSLDYPGGDVPADRGVCTDVIVRALRVARAIDLQRQVHEDIRPTGTRIHISALGVSPGPIRTSTTVVSPISWPSFGVPATPRR
jgi:hypothetical protein